MWIGTVLMNGLSSVGNSSGLRDRGLLREGMCADIVIFDEKEIADKADYFKNSCAYSHGIEYVFVNGKTVIEMDNPTGLLPGKVLRGPGYKPS